MQSHLTELNTSHDFNLWRWLKSRLLSASALTATLVLLILSLTQPPEQIEWLYRDNGIAIQHLQVVYALLSLALILIMPFEPQIRREARETHALGLLAVTGAIISFMVVRFIKPDEAWRFFRSPGILWFVIVHAVFLCALAVLLVLDHPLALINMRIRRYALIFAALGGCVMIAVHILSVGNFLTLDLPDEMWLGSTAVNYAEQGGFYSSYLAGAFGDPDPFLPRYYVLMGEWARLLHDTSLVSLRAFSLLIAAAGVALSALILIRQASLSRLQKAAGIVVMLGFSPLVRASHNLRMDVGLSVYGALLLLGLLGFLRAGRSRWLALLGGALVVGMELIPPLALLFNGVIGCFLIGLALTRRAFWQHVIVYAGICLLAGLIYGALHFLPDIPQSVDNYIRYMNAYYGGRVAFDFGRVLEFARISAFLSPVEVVVVVGALSLAWRSKRVVVLIFCAAAIIGTAFGSVSYGYLAAFAPFVAYFAAHAVRSRAAVVIGIFILLPALLAAPLYDMMTAVHAQPNSRTLDEVGLLSWRVPAGATVWGDTLFWFTLHDQASFMGRPGPSHIASERGLTLLEAVKDLGVSVVICNSEDEEMCSIGQELFGQPYEFVTTNARYLMYSALGSQ